MRASDLIKELERVMYDVGDLEILFDTFEGTHTDVLQVTTYKDYIDSKLFPMLKQRFDRKIIIGIE